VNHHAKVYQSEVSLHHPSFSIPTLTITLLIPTVHDVDF